MVAIRLYTNLREINMVNLLSVYIAPSIHFIPNVFSRVIQQFNHSMLVTSNVVDSNNGFNSQINSLSNDPSDIRYSQSNNMNNNIPLVVLGDFNAHCYAWGSEYENNREMAIIDILNQHNLIFLNDGTNTRIAKPPQRSSVTDLTLCSALLAVRPLVWRVLEDTLGSDHLPITTTFLNLTLTHTVTNFVVDLTKNINWNIYQNNILSVLNDNENERISMDAKM